MSANTHHTKLKGDIAVAAVILDLTKKGYIISEPMSENAPYDLICDTGNKLLKIQVKYRKDGIIPYRTSWADKNGTHISNIDTSKIDYFALVNEDYSKICYPISTLAGCTIKWELPVKSQAPFYYYEDFLNFEFNKIHKRTSIIIKNNNLPVSKTKIEWPSKEELEKLLWEKPTTYIAKDLGVSDKAVEKHVKKLGLTKPPRGYWAKSQSNS